MLLNYHIGRFVLGSLCVGASVRMGLSSVRVAGCSLQHGHHSNQQTTNREQNDRWGNSTAQSQAPDDGYINIRNMLNT